MDFTIPPKSHLLSFEMGNLLRLLPMGMFTLFGNTTDMIILVAYKMWKDRNFILPYLQGYVTRIHFHLLVVFVSVFIIFLTLLHIQRMFMGFRVPDTDLGDFIAKPRLFPCRTAHTRFFPKKNSFSYPYIMVGVPIGWKGVTGGMLSVDMPRGHRSRMRRLLSFKPWSCWYTVDADDHLGRGHVEGGLEEKLHKFLKTQDENPGNYPYTYLMTPPRLFGYYSNPVSIWNLYSSKKELTAIILEVNNTFNERHNYFLKLDPNAATNSQSDGPPRFIQHWPKDFHVSPFNSREGSYSISAVDPIYPALSGPGTLNTTITLSSSKKHPKLVARVFSDNSAIDPATMSFAEKTGFLFVWWWVSFMTFPRTVQQAVRLLWTKKMKFITRPEPRINTMCRDANTSERFLEYKFKMFLTKIVEECPKPFILKYIPAGLVDIEGDVFYSRTALTAPPEECEYLEVKVLTPLFYPRFVSYPKALDALLSEHQESKTISISSPHSLDFLDFTIFAPPNTVPESVFQDLDHFSLAILRYLRSPPDPIENEETTKRNLKKEKALHIPRHKNDFSKQSDFDHFVLFNCLKSDRLRYTMSLTKLFLVNIFGFGLTELLDLEIFVIRFGAVCFCAGYYLR